MLLNSIFILNILWTETKFDLNQKAKKSKVEKEKGEGGNYIKV